MKQAKRRQAQLTVRLDTDLLYEVQQAAERDHRSVNGEVVYALEQLVRETQQERERTGTTPT